MKPSMVIPLALFTGLAGCTSPAVEQRLNEAASAYREVSEDAQVLRIAPKDVVRAGESLERAERFAGYRGGAEDALHYAYLSTRYSEIARQHSEQSLNQEWASRLGMEQARLRLMLQEARLLQVQQAGNQPVDPLFDLAAAETDRGLVVTLGDVLFESGSAVLGTSANRTLLRLAHYLQVNPARIVRVEGYSDNRGSAEENLALSKARAQAVEQVLRELGVAEQRIEVAGYGEQFRIAENASARGRAQNRRVEIVLSDEKGQLAPAR